MKGKRNFLAVLLLIIVLICSACAPIVEERTETTTVYTTFYPIYALTNAIVDGAENIEVRCLVQPQDGCLRSYALSDWDIYMLAYSADALIAAGNGLEGFSQQLEVMGESSLPVAEVMYGMNAYEITERMNAEESHFSGEIPYQYLSPEYAEEIADRIHASMVVLSAENAEVFDRNLETVKKQLEEIRTSNVEQTMACNDIPTAVLNEALFYPALDVGMNVVAWYERESGEMLYGKNLQECLDALKEAAAEVVIVERQAPSALVNTLETNGFAVAKLDTMSTLGENDGTQGYFDVLMSNYTALSEVCKGILEKVEESE